MASYSIYKKADFFQRSFVKNITRCVNILLYDSSLVTSHTQSDILQYKNNNINKQRKWAYIIKTSKFDQRRTYDIKDTIKRCK